MSFNLLRWYTQISEIIKGNNADIDTSIGTIIGDAVVLPTAILYEKVSKINDMLLKLTNLDDLVSAINNEEFLEDTSIALDITPQEVKAILIATLENIAKDYGLTRLPEKSAEGIVYFQFTPSTAKTYTVTTNDRIKSVFNLWYTPKQNYSFQVDPNAPPNSPLSEVKYYVPELGGYAFPIEVVCETPGTLGNIAPGQIAFDQFGTPTDFTFATNLSNFSGGRLQETDSELADRIKSKWKGLNIGTIGGYKDLLSKYGYNDIYISGHGDKYMFRSADPGAVDIYVRGGQIVSSIQSLNFPKSGEYSIRNLPEINSYLPIYSITLISTPEPNATIELIKDDSNSYKKSSRANDKLNVSTPGNYQIQFLYNNGIKSIQSLLNSDDHRVLGQDIVVREPIPIDITIELDVIGFSGYSLNAIQQQIINAIIEYVNNKKLGEYISQSDIIAIIESIPGVDLIKTPFKKFNKTSEVEMEPSIETITLEKIEYFNISSITINV